MQSTSDDSLSEIRFINFGNVPVDTINEKHIFLQNKAEKALTYRLSYVYVLNNIDNVFSISITSTPVDPGECADLKLIFNPCLPGQSFTEYYLVDDTVGNAYRVTVTGQSFGPEVFLDRKKIIFRICKNVSEQRRETVNLINKSSLDAIFQWLIPVGGQGYFQISTGNCGVIRAYETIPICIMFNETVLGVYTSELVCVVLHQEPLILNTIGTVALPGNPILNIEDHVFEKRWKIKPRCTHLMENSLNRLTYIPAASVFERYLDFGTGSITDITLNISQTLCVTNHGGEDGFIEWVSDPENVFMIDPISSVIPPCESRLFTVRFRPKIDNEAYGYLMCGDFQQNAYEGEDGSMKIRHTWFRIPCIGNTWGPCVECPAEWDCPNQVTLPPTVPTRTTFVNFVLSNKLDIPMHFKFEAPFATNFVVMPMCGIVQSRGWQILSAALEPKSFGEYVETWDLIINKIHKTRVCLNGSAEISLVEAMSHGYNPNVHAMYEFPPTITGALSYCSAYLRNLTRMEIHMRVLTNAPWLGADNCGTIVLPPKEIVRFRWWFFPKEHDKVYETTVTCSCVCLINGRPVGQPTDLCIHISGFSELPNLRVLPKTNNLHDVVVGEKATCSITLYNYGSCYFTSKLYHEIDGMGDDFSEDRFEIDSDINSLKPSTYCPVTFTVIPSGAGARQIDIKYTVLFRTQFDEVAEIQPITKTICIVWYDGIYPTLKVYRTISMTCPIILSNHCVWNIVNVEELNKAFEDCRPNKRLEVNLYAPDLCVRPETVELIFVLGCVYNVPVEWDLRREKICDCEMIEVQIGISTYEMRHTCTHRPMVKLCPATGVVTPDCPGFLNLKFKYIEEGQNTLCYIISMPNQRSVKILLNIRAHITSKGILVPLRRIIDETEYLAVLDCGIVPINNLDPVIRIVWLYNPTDVFTTWRLLRGNIVTSDTVLRCLLYFAEVPPLGKLAIPFAFLPAEMIDYEMAFFCSFGYETVKILVKGQGGLPNCIESRLDVPKYVPRSIRAVYKENLVYLSKEHFTIPDSATHSLEREILAIINDTDHVMRFIWLPERIANIVNIVMTPCWGVIPPKSTEWITMTVYTLQEPAIFTTTVACELLDLTERKRYQKNELLRRVKIEKCHQEFIITEEGTFHPGLNDSPPYVLDIKKPQPTYLTMSVAISTKGQRDGHTRMLLSQMWNQTPPYDLLSSDMSDYNGDRQSNGNNMTIADIIRIIDGILWDTLHSKMFKNQLEYYSKEEIPTYEQLICKLENETKPVLSRRVTSGICDAIVNKAVFHVYGLNSKRCSTLMEAEE